MKPKPKPKPTTAPAPRGIQYLALKGMGYRPSTRDEHRKGRKQARQSLRKGDW